MKYLPSRRRAAVGAASTAALALVLAACTTQETTTEPTDEDVAEATVADDDLDALYNEALATGVVTIYGPYQSTYAPVYDAFSAEYPGLRVETVDLSGAQLTSTLEAEFAAGSISVDALVTGTIDVNQYAANGWITAGLPADAAELDPTYVAADETFIAPFGVPTVLAYNTDRFSAEDLPSTWAEILDPAYAGEVAIADPSMPGLATQALASLTKYDVIDEAYLAELQSVVTIAPNQAQALQELATGQQGMELIASYDLVVSAMNDGAPVDFIVLDDANPFIPSAYALIEGSPNPAGGRLLQEWILSDAAQTALAEISNQGTMPDAPAALGGLPPLSEIAIVVADLTADELAAGLETFVTTFGGR